MRISSNYGLKLMEGTDNVKRQDFVDNFSKIDTEMRAIENEAYPIVEATGTNAYIGANVRIQSLKKGTKLTLFVGTNATGNCSLNLNSYGAKNIKDSNGNIVTNMKANIPYNLCYNGTDFILQGKGGGGNLIPKYLLAGYYGEGDNGRVDGAMANNGAVTSTLTAGTSYTIPAGYHNGSGKITANNLASQTNATATAPQILSGQTAYVNGNKITGNMPNLSSNSSISYENGNSTKVIVGDQAFGPITNTDGTNRVLIRYNNTNGFVTGNTLVGVSTSNMASVLGITANKIVAGNTICGVAGTATVGSMGGRRCIFGQFKPINVQYEFKNMNGVAFNFYVISVSGIPFTPRFVFAWDITNITSSTIFERNDGRIIVTRFKSGNTSGFQEQFPLETNGQAIFKEWLQLPVANTNTWNYIILE
ncbi:hypothetical protein [Clostridium butyricum]|uniref:hypothetical protein n=1 Tax=Clostridium butyricum TaxID=1492 RepID=UPI000AAFCA41|nr:hypothetical protein [Clostridium butyricum]